MDWKVYLNCKLRMRCFFTAKEISPETRNSFLDWLMNGEDCQEKELAMEQTFTEFINDACMDKQQAKNNTVVS